MEVGRRHGRRAQAVPGCDLTRRGRGPRRRQEPPTLGRPEDRRRPPARPIGYPYELRDDEVDPEDLAAESVALKLGMPAEPVFKTLVVRGDRRGVCLAVIPGAARLDLKALARETGDRKVDTVPLRDVRPLTGYIRGGVTAPGCKKDYPVYLDETSGLFDLISISAGRRGVQIPIAPDDDLRAVGAKAAAIARGKDSLELGPTRRPRLGSHAREWPAITTLSGKAGPSGAAHDPEARQPNSPPGLVPFRYVPIPLPANRPGAARRGARP